MLTIFSCGAGQESTYILHKIATDKEYRAKHVRGTLIVVGADTGDEHPHTYDHIKQLEILCKLYRIPFFWVTSDMGYHPKTWQSLISQYRLNDGIGSAAFIQTCTDNLKVKVVDNFTEQYLRKDLYEAYYGSRWKTTAPTRKKIFYEYTKWHGDGQKIRLILGFAAGEESRTVGGDRFDAKWKKDNVERYFPLIVDGVDRQQCIDYNEANFSHQVWPSNCMRCFYQSDQEVLWLFRNYPAKFWEWVELEKRKLLRYNSQSKMKFNKKKGIFEPSKNLGVYGTITLTQKLEKAQKLYGHWSDEQLNEYKYSHGHCIKSKY